MGEGTLPTFDQSWSLAGRAQGWLTEEQGAFLYAAAAALPPRPVVLEIGSYHGRSTVLLARAVDPKGGQVVAVDPFVEDWKFGASGTRAAFEGNIGGAKVDHVVELVEEYSTRLRPTWSRPLDLLFIDGKHDYWTFTDDLRWCAHLPAGAPVLVHDCFSSIGVTLGVLVKVLPSRTLRYEGRVGSLAAFRTGRPTLRDRARILGELPWWVRNVGIKVLLRLRLNAVARALGHDSPYDPY